MSVDRLFRPLKLGNIELSHRLVLAPLTRVRADAQHIPSPFAKEYYGQRASTPGTLLITEGTFISPRAGGYPNVPGIWNSAHIAAWKEIVDTVHARGSFIFLQLWSLGRAAFPGVLNQEEGGPYLPSSSSPISLPAEETVNGVATGVPHVLTDSEIVAHIQEFVQAAKNAMEAGFDGVEILGGNGFLIDQFTQDVTNHRTDAWGGSVKKRARFMLDITKAVVNAVGDSRKVGMRLSPWNTFQCMGMKDPKAQFDYIITELKKLNVAYLHLVESRESGVPADAVYFNRGTTEMTHFIDLWGTENPVLLSGGFTPEKAVWAATEISKGDNLAFAFGRSFISNPDLPYRVKNGISLRGWDRPTFYTPGAVGYVDYEFSKEWQAEHSSEGVKGPKGLDAHQTAQSVL